MDVTVKTKVAWPHEILWGVGGGENRQRINYDQLSLTQWGHSFCKNILDEPSDSRRNTMVSYMGDLMEDSTDFTWQGAKVAHAVLLCEMELGKVDWGDQDWIDRISRAYTLKKKFNLAYVCFKKTMIQMVGCTDIFVHTVCSMGKQLGHAGKDCTNKRNASKMTQGLPVIRIGQPENIVKACWELSK